MAIEDAAVAAVPLWTRDNAITMVAISGAESGYAVGAAGDHIDFLACWRWERELRRGECHGPHYELYRAELWEELGAYACNGYTSIGLWQIHMPGIADTLIGVTGSHDACEWAAYLEDAAHNAAMARMIFDYQGFNAWTMYRNRGYENYIQEATVAVDAAIAGELPPEAPPLYPLTPPLLPFPSASFLQLAPRDPADPADSRFLELAPVEPP